MLVIAHHKSMRWHKYLRHLDFHQAQSCTGWHGLPAKHSRHISQLAATNSHRHPFPAALQHILASNWVHSDNGRQNLVDTGIEESLSLPQSTWKRGI